jgi:hypothetical protein
MALFAAVPHLHFLIPCYGGQISEATFTSFVRFTVQARDWGIDWTLDTLVNESLIPRGRNALVARAMANPLATHVMFVDSDIMFEPADVLALVQEDVEVIGGGYPKKNLPIDYVINPSVDGFQDEGKIEVMRLGTGFLLIKRHVFSRIAEASPHLKYVDDCGLDPSLNPYLYAYFDCGLVPGHDVYMSEDWMFCNRWRDLGGKVYLSKRFALGHVGAFLFSEAAQARVLSSMMMGSRADSSIPSAAEAAPEFEGAPAADDLAPDVEGKRSVKPRRSTRSRKGA